MGEPDNRGGSGRPLPPEATRFKPGQSGNPAGRPKGLKRLMREARKSGLELVQVLRDIALDREAKDAARVQAATALLDRGYGKPKETLELSGPEGGPVVTRNVGALTDAELLVAERLAAKAEADAGKGKRPKR